MSDQTSAHWWWCLTHRTVEPDRGCGHKDRLGPYPTREAAEAALSTAAGRSDVWDEEDLRWSANPPGP